MDKEEEETYYKVLDLESKDKGKEKIKFEYAVAQNIYRMYFDTEVEKTVYVHLLYLEIFIFQVILSYQAEPLIRMIWKTLVFFQILY